MFYFNPNFIQIWTEIRGVPARVFGDCRQSFALQTSLIFAPPKKSGSDSRCSREGVLEIATKNLPWELCS